MPAALGYNDLPQERIMMFQRLFSRIASVDPAPPWTLANALTTLVAAVAAVILGSTLAAVLFADLFYNLLIGWTLAALLMIGFILFTRREPSSLSGLWRSRGATEPNAYFLLLIGIGLAVTLDIITRGVTVSFLPEAELMVLYFGPRPIPPAALIVASLYMALFQPFAEAMLFQGMLLTSLRGWLGPWPGFLATAAVYGLFHLLMYPAPLQGFPGIWYSLVVPLIAALIYNSVRLYTGSTRAAALAHIAFGLFTILKLLTIVG
jgi:membrane protease YdiL (CAAX protease family)